MYWFFEMSRAFLCEPNDVERALGHGPYAASLQQVLHVLDHMPAYFTGERNVIVCHISRYHESLSLSHPFFSQWVYHRIEREPKLLITYSAGLLHPRTFVAAVMQHGQVSWTDIVPLLPALLETYLNAISPLVSIRHAMYNIPPYMV